MIPENTVTLPRAYLEVLKRERTIKGDEMLRTTHILTIVFKLYVIIRFILLWV